MSNNVKKVLLVGAGNMALEYIKVLDALDAECVIVGNRQETVDTFNEKTGKNAVSGGIDNYFKEKTGVPDYAIVAVNVEKLYETSRCVIEAGVPNVLIEKPAALKKSDMDELIGLSKENHSNVYIAYNRRFYASVDAAKKIIDDDGGLLSFNFEFTEWAHVLEKLSHPECVKQNMFLANSTHVVDLAFYLAGNPKTIKSYISGGFSWHKAGSIYSGCGVTERDIPFVYQANWNAPGRWGAEFLTSQHRIYLRPLEKLQIQNKGSVAVEFCEIDDSLDTEYKPGLYNEVRAFLFGEGAEKLCRLEEQRVHMDLYESMSGEKY